MILSFGHIHCMPWVYPLLRQVASFGNAISTLLRRSTCVVSGGSTTCRPQRVLFLINFSRAPSGWLPNTRAKLGEGLGGPGK